MEPIEKVALAMLAEADSTHLWDDLPPSAQADLEQSPKPPSARCWTGWSWWLGGMIKAHWQWYLFIVKTIWITGPKRPSIHSMRLRRPYD